MTIPDASKRLSDALNSLDDFSITLDDVSAYYWKYHRRRFEWFCQRLQQLEAECNYHHWPFKRILDIGNSYQTLLMEHLLPHCRIDTMGFLADRYAPKNEYTHLPFDLNDAFYPEKWITVDQKYDVIVFLEVVEHLYTSPTQVYQYLKSLLNPGGFLIVGTPNAVALKKRYAMLKGRNPYELIREVRNDPGHFREYTIDELCNFGNQTGLEVRDWEICNYYKDGSKIDRFLDKLSDYLPQRFRSASTIIYRNPPN